MKAAPTRGGVADVPVLGFIGLGVMGSRMCANLIRRSGATVVVYDPAREALDRAIAQGGQPCSDVAGVARSAEIVFLSLPGIAQVEAVCDQLLAAPQRPRVVVDMSTSDAARTRLLACRLRDGGLTLVDAPVARLRQAAEDGTLLITAGAGEDMFAEFARSCPAWEATSSTPVASATARS